MSTLLMLLRATTTRGRGTFVVGLLLATAGLAWRYPVLAALGGCLALLVLAELISVVGSRGVGVDRRVAPEVVTRHGECHGTLTVTGRRRRGLVRLDVGDLVDGQLIPVRLPERPDAEGHEATSVSYDIPTPRRGLVDVGPVRVRLVGLTGMAAHATEAGGIDQVRVLPRRIPLLAMVRGHRRSPSGADESLELGGTDLVGLHHYAMGDDLRRLHWATSARTGTLMVREDAEPSEPHVVVLLDDRAASYRTGTGASAVQHDDAFEEAVELTAAVCRVAAEAGSPLRLTTASETTHVTVPASAGRAPRREQQEIEWRLAEIDVVGEAPGVELGDGDLDVAVVITGPGADLQQLGMALGSAAVRVIAVVDPAPAVTTSHEAGLLILRGTTSVSLAMLWDHAVLR